MQVGAMPPFPLAARPPIPPIALLLAPPTPVCAGAFPPCAPAPELLDGPTAALVTMPELSGVKWLLRERSEQPTTTAAQTDRVLAASSHDLMVPM